MISFIQIKGRDEVFAASLVKMLKRCDDERVAPVLLSALKDSSPLVRAAAAESLAHKPSFIHARALAEAAKDSYRLVRIKAAASLTEYPKQVRLKDEEKSINAAFNEYRDFLLQKPDQWQSWFSVGSMYMKLDQLKDAIAAFQEALKRDQKSVKTLLSLSNAQVLAGDAKGTVKSLADAIVLDPENEATISLAGKVKYGKVALEQAEIIFVKMIADDPKSARGAYGLCIITESDRLAESLKWCKKAMENNQDEPKSAFAYARTLDRAGRSAEAEFILVQFEKRFPSFDAHFSLLSDVYKRLGKQKESDEAKDRIKMKSAGDVSLSSCSALNKGQLSGFER